MDRTLLPYLADEKLGIPEKLTHAHDELRAGFARAAREPGALGVAVRELMEMCMPHFRQEEDSAFRAFGMLHDVMAGRARLDTGVRNAMLAQLGEFHDASRDHHRGLSAATEALLQRANEEKNGAIASLARRLKYHEKIEDKVLYPTIRLIDESLLGILEA
ncbi:MAG: hypothetical protein IH606_16215 [Burkholderiales bacterium]|nr:hypothetical protein [Burkholderiales bacterium]